MQLSCGAEYAGSVSRCVPGCVEVEVAGNSVKKHRQGGRKRLHPSRPDRRLPCSPQVEVMNRCQLAMGRSLDANMGRQDGWSGARRSRIFASSGVRFALWALHLTQASTQFCQVV